MNRVIALLSSLLICGGAWADWVLDGERSQLNFVSIKAGDVGEVHRFAELSGTVTEAGEANVVIELASVDTLTGGSAMPRCSSWVYMCSCLATLLLIRPG